MTVLGLQKAVGWSSTLALPFSGLSGLALAAIALFRCRHWAPNWRALTLEVEAGYPELRGRLLTAVQQQGKPEAGLNYLQQRVIDEAIAHSRHNDWTGLFPLARLAFAFAAHGCVLALFALVLWNLRVPSGHGVFVAADEHGITVTPGDESLERGSGLVVAAHSKGLSPREWSW